MALRRIRKEIKDNDLLTGTNIVYEVNTADTHKWIVAINGPEDTPFEDGIFYFGVKLPNDYPFKPPRVRLLNNIIYH